MSVIDVTSAVAFWGLWPLGFLWLAEWPNRFRPAFREVVKGWAFLPAVTMAVLITWLASPDYTSPLVVIPWGALIAWGYYRKFTDYEPLRGYRLDRDNHEVIE